MTGENSNENRRTDAGHDSIRAKPRETLRTAPGGWLILFGACVVAAVTLTVVGFVTTRPDDRDPIYFLVLLALAIVQAELSRQIERERRGISGRTHIDVTTVWLVAGATLLRPGWAALLPVLMYAHLWFRVWRSLGSWPLHRMTGTAAALVIACWSASSVLYYSGAMDGSGIQRIATDGVIAAAVIEAVDVAIIAASMHLFTGARKLVDLVGTWGDNALELVTLCLGVTTAVLLTSDLPATVALVFPPLLIMHRATLTDLLQSMAVRDSKTGVYSNAGWQIHAEQELTRMRERGKTAGILMVDADNFKTINDTHGHLAGDAVLKEIANAIRANVRKRDIVGRFGGEEFAVILPSIDADDVCAVGERVRTAVEALEVLLIGDAGPSVIDTITVSIGVAMYPDAGNTVHALLDAADSALYEAKQTGRNRLVRWLDVKR